MWANRLRRLACLAACAVVLADCGYVPSPSDIGPSVPGAIGRHTSVGPLSAPIKLYSEEEGQGAPILLLHGFGASTYTWRHVRTDLARTNQVIAVDLKGFGRSDKPLDESYSVFDQAKLLAEFVAVRNLRKLTLAGHSYGGAVALALALELERSQPRRLARLILIDAAAYHQGLPPALHVLRTPVLGAVTAAAIPPSVQSTAALALAYADPSKIRQEDVAAYARPLYEPGNRHALVRTAEQIIPEHINILTRRYRTIAKPTLLVWCRNDKIVPIEIGQRLARELPKARLEVIESCGHVPHEEEPAATLALVRDFLAR